jgi:hypothetical protein
MSDDVLLSPTVLVLVSATLATLYGVAALFFLRFHARTGDRLFAWFATAFLLLSVQRFALILAREWGESTLWLYGLRLLAFVLILVAIVEKNRSVAPRAR